MPSTAGETASRMKARCCPHCQETIPAETGYSFDADLSVRCGNCNRVVFPTTPAAENEIDLSLRTPWVQYSQQGQIVPRLFPGSYVGPHFTEMGADVDADVD